MSDSVILIGIINRAIEDGDLELNEWETNFLESVSQLAKAGHPLSEKQDVALEKLWRKAINEDGGIAEHEAEDD